MNLWGLFAFSVFMAHAQTNERIRLGVSMRAHFEIKSGCLYASD
jgi:hypothetical protein